MIRSKIKKFLGLTAGSTRMVFCFGNTAVKIPRIDSGAKLMIVGWWSNREEIRKWNRVLDENNVRMRQTLCPVTGSFFFGFILTMERAQKTLEGNGWYVLYEKRLKHPNYAEYVTDVTPKNLMWLNYRMVVVDYATHPHPDRVGTSGKLIVLHPDKKRKKAQTEKKHQATHKATTRPQEREPDESKDGNSRNPLRALNRLYIDMTKIGDRGK